MHSPIVNSTCLTLLVGLGLLGVPDRARCDDPREALDRLSRGEQFMQGGKIDAAVHELRLLLDRHAGTHAAARGLRLLTRHGFGAHTQVVLRARAPLVRRGLTEESLIPEIEKNLGDLWLFLAQTHGIELSHEFKILVHDSRSGYLGVIESARRRSQLAPMPAGPTHRTRHRIDVYHDARLRSPVDARQVIVQGITREMARAGLRLGSRVRLPAILEVGLADYLALRLSPRQLSSVRQTLETLTRAKARKSRGMVARPRDLEDLLLAGDPVGEMSPRLYWRWVAVGFALVDTLLAPAGGPDGAEVPATFRNAPRNRELQNFLREFSVGAPAGFHEQPRAVRLRFLETLLERHFGRGIADLQRAFIRHVGSYPLEDDGLDLLPEI